MSSVYAINKGVGRPIEFKGLQAQYIAYLAGGLVALLLLFAVSYLLGLGVWICLVMVFGLGSLLFSRVFRLSRQYGAHGLMKKRAKRGLPFTLRFRTRSEFLKLRR